MNIMEGDETDMAENDNQSNAAPMESADNKERLAPIASCETIQTCSSGTNSSVNFPKSKEEHKEKHVDFILPNTTSVNLNEKTNSMIENVVNNLTKVNVSDGIFTLNNGKKYNGSTKPLAASFDSKNPDIKTINGSDIFSNQFKYEDDFMDYKIEEDEYDDANTEEDYDYRIDSSNRTKYKKLVNGKKSFNGSISSATSSASRLTVTPKKIN